jgi:HAD superfamily hydrolase (TIGR01549 family)
VITRPIRGILFDVDGTLYHEAPLRYFMRLEFCSLPLREKSYTSAYKVWCSIQHFRRVREDLRRFGELDSQLEALQYIEAARQAGEDPARMEAIVTEWIYSRPLKYLKLCKRRGLDTFLTFLEKRSIKTGAFSDYPVVDKLQALGLADHMSLALCSVDPAINALKPHPKGFLHACELWGLAPAEVLYIGDRPDVDCAGASNAGMRCALLGGRALGMKDRNTSPWSFSSFRKLQQAISEYC